MATIRGNRKTAMQPEDALKRLDAISRDLDNLMYDMEMDSELQEFVGDYAWKMLADASDALNEAGVDIAVTMSY